MIEPASGYLACGDTGPGKMPEPEILLEYILREIAMEKDLKGKKILVTAGPTQEAIDPVRYITNHSSGKMGYAIAREADVKRRGSDSCERALRHRTAALCEADPGGYRKGYVRGGHFGKRQSGTLSSRRPPWRITVR